ncbi:MAG TPA: Nif11-like leader peptide family natural product precursor [Nostocaceae cyanobacterium]|nr:Nif11-like leader peptide family natural product precursor [Nostocaceae cyanobacterium]
MSLEQVQAFYELLNSNQNVYEQYLNKCCYQGILGSYHWDKKRIINFAATLGYNFTENELNQMWFEV